MGVANTRHRPLMAGIGVSDSVGTQGTLTGLATRRSDGKRVLVTCLHVMAGSVQTMGRLTGAWLRDAPAHFIPLIPLPATAAEKAVISGG